MVRAFGLRQSPAAFQSLHRSDAHAFQSARGLAHSKMNMPADAQPVAQFGETRFTRKKRRNEIIAQCVFAAMVACIIIPLILIVSYIVKEGASLISWKFLTTNPTHGMRQGGIWSALLGTFWLVGVSLCISA